MKDHREDFADLLGRYRVRTGLKQQDLANKIGVHRNTIVYLENRTRLPAFRGQVLQLADELCLLKEERKAFLEAAKFSVEWWPAELLVVPYQHDPYFIGREDVLHSLQQLLVPGSITALTQAISGLGGIGKTHTAVEYAYRFHQHYEAVLWLQADSWEVLTSECIKLAAELGLPEQKETDKIVREVQRWLQKHRRWLLILDNVEKPQEILPKFVPTGHQGSVLATTRVHDVEPLAQTQVLSMLPEQEGVLFLMRRTKKIALAAGLEQASTEQCNEAQQIWQLMDGLPLALDQAGAYILETGCSFSAYREQYTRRRSELLHRRGKRFIGHEASVATTLSLAFERVEVLNQVATDILRACSLLHGESIPEELFQEGAEHLGSRLAINRDSWDLAIGVLHDYSLVQRNTDVKTLTVHRLVQAVLQDAMPAPEQEVWIERVIAAMNTVFPQVEYTTWSQCERLVPHVRACMTSTQSWKSANTTSTQSWKSANLDLAPLLFRTAMYLGERAQYIEAELLFQRTLHLWEQTLGPEHPELASLLNNLAALYFLQGKYVEAESLFQRALHLWEQAQGPDNLEVTSALTNLATIYAGQGKYVEAESLFQRALRIWEQAQGPDNPNRAYALNGLAGLYRSQGKYVEAESLFQRALRIWEQAQGLDHPNVAKALNGLASLYADQGKYVEAEPLFQRALRIWEQADHPEVAYALNGLAGCYANQGKYVEAEPLIQRALHIWEQAQGLDHPEVAPPLTNLATLYRLQGKYAEAEPLYQRALGIIEKARGPEDFWVTYPLTHLATIYRLQGKYVEAEPLLQRAAAIRERYLGPHYP